MVLEGLLGGLEVDNPTRYVSWDCFASGSGIVATGVTGLSRRQGLGSILPPILPLSVGSRPSLCLVKVTRKKRRRAQFSGYPTVSLPSFLFVIRRDMSHGNLLSTPQLLQTLTGSNMKE